MPYSNRYLREFTPIFMELLREKGIAVQKLNLEVIDEESERESIFEPAGIDEVLWQLADHLNYLTIYTERPKHFEEFADTVYIENGLMTVLKPKSELREQFLSDIRNGQEGKKKGDFSFEKLVLDFEWNGPCYFGVMKTGKDYIPIHKKPWKIAENLDIIVPFGSNTVIVKNRKINKRKPVQDRFDEAFYSQE